MSYLLNLVYAVVGLVASPWLLYRACRTRRYRQGWWAKLFGVVPRRIGEGPCVWLHAVSLGEVNLIGPLVAEMLRRRPELDCVISTTTATGYAQAKRQFAEHLVFFCPLDFSWAVQAAVNRIRPDVLALVELELWPNLIRAATARGAKVAVVNGRLSDRSYRGYRHIASFAAWLLEHVDLVAAQNETYAHRFRALGVAKERVHVTGSLKFDNARGNRRDPEVERLRRLAGFEQEDLVLMAGSTHDPEERAALDVFRGLAPKFPRLRLVIVPRHPERFDDVAGLLADSKLPWQRRSELVDGRGAKSDARILLVDTTGELAHWWGTASIAFVGGSLGGRGGQNMLEPAAYGAAVCFGPNTSNFRDVVAALLEAEAAVVVSDAAELSAFARRCLEDRKYAADLGHRAQRLVSQGRGAVERTSALVEGLLPVEPPAWQINQRRAA